MPNNFDNTGLTVQSNTETVNALVAAMQSIYGASINVQSNSPDGQLIGIFAQSVTDMLELLLDTYNSFSIQNVYGTVLDQRVALNGIARKQGTYTITNVTVTATQALTLTGLDVLVSNPNALVFTVSDSSGNQYQLITTYSFVGPGSAVLAFQAVTLGPIQPIVNSITTQTTTVLGVTSVNNPSVYTSLGVAEESDPQLKIRHAQSFALAGSGPADSIQAALLSNADVTDALVIENATSATVLGTPANSIWAIVTGGTPAEIAQSIYAKKTLGCGMRGTQSYTVTRPNGNGFTALWDTSIAQPLYIKFSIAGKITGTFFNNTFLIASLAAALVYKLGQSPTVGDIVTAMLVIAPNGYLTNIQVSVDGVTWAQVVTPMDYQHYFTVSIANISIV